MARYITIDTSPRLLAVDLEKQLLPGGYEHAVYHLIDHEFDLSRFDTRYCNDQSGASDYPPWISSASGTSSGYAANTSPSLPSIGRQQKSETP